MTKRQLKKRKQRKNYEKARNVVRNKKSRIKKIKENIVIPIDKKTEIATRINHGNRCVENIDSKLIYQRYGKIGEREIEIKVKPQRLVSRSKKKHKKVKV